MASERSVTLFTRQGCHLCEHVESLLNQLEASWQPVDIETDAELELKYGLRIPVVFLPEADEELAFPFDVQALREFLKG